ncbi:KRAB-A domain-containing protein 2 [Trichonephila clavipes]|uniref:KRAB-A domain-containing protein 2 n=1 Tax=Trichonephila clavipes TaxID=2585209 RepID=A0A8X6RUE1_TRICX|nr:KRAB-A domain-containing protein 2 [Trichonephila clavipes]
MIVHGKPRHSHSQGISEGVNQDIENRFCSWMSDNKCDRWSEGLCILQFTKNRAYHFVIKRLTHEALLGCKSKQLVSSSSMSAICVAKTVLNRARKEKKSRLISGECGGQGVDLSLPIK